ncbi:MAG: acyl-CoA synthetase FdrA [Proteobacteria bacterium]|nr:acyl-CoA synthetase FdrA [Pseudomonadota bacterium]
MNLNHARRRLDTSDGSFYIAFDIETITERNTDVPISATIRTNLYKDSVALMRIAEVVRARDHVQRVTLVMGTPANKAIVSAAGLYTELLDAARPNDIMIVVDADTDEALAAATAEIAGLLDGTGAGADASAAVAAAIPLRSIAMGRARAGSDAALAQISVPGPYAAAEALKALRLGLHVFLFSDNVPLEQERAVKDVARRKGLLVMGPDCGTAIVNGTPLGFANVVRSGSIGLVGASGTGLQEATCQIHALGHGVRHAIGTGGRDVYAEIGGTTMSQAIALLAADAGTRVIAIVSKPPAPAVARQILKQLVDTGKPAVVLFIGADLSGEALPRHVIAVSTLYDVAAAAVALADGKPFVPSALAEESVRAADAEARRLAPGQRYLRGLYSGGTFCTEAQVLWRALDLRVHSNAPVAKGAQPDAAHSHSAIDLGDDEYTVGRPHPMIDARARVDCIAQAAADPSTAAIVLDVVLGYAGHEDPAGALAPAIVQAKAAAAKAGRYLPVITFVCGTEEDPQRLSHQQAQLRDAGALVLPNHTSAARLAGRIAMHAAAYAERVAETEGQ